MPIGAIQGSSATQSVVSKVSNVAFDPKDTNQDGIVSASEELAYALQHPELGVEATPPTRYTQSGGLAPSGQPSSGALNLLA